MEKAIIIIPAYNEEKNIGKILEELIDYKQNNEIALIIDILVVNDCSTDSTTEICKSLNVNMIDLPCNLGIGGAVQTGYLYARENDYDFAVQIDGDGQHDPIYLNIALEPLLFGKADLVIGSRFIENKGFQSTLSRRFGIRFFTYLITLLGGSKISDPTSGFRACNKEMLNYFSNQYPKDYPEPESIMSSIRNGFRIIEVPVIMRQRDGGISSINLKRSFYYMFKVSLAILIDSLRKKKITSGE